MVLPTLPSQLDPLRTFTTTDLKPQSKAENCSQTPLWRFPWIKLLQKGQSMQELCHSFPVCWRSWNVSSTEMLSWACRVEAVDTKAVLMPCLCLAFKQLCYSSSVKGEISSALALPVHLIARDDNCKLLMLFLSSPTQFCLPTSLFFFSQSKGKPKDLFAAWGSLWGLTWALTRMRNTLRAFSFRFGMLQCVQQQLEALWSSSCRASNNDITSSYNCFSLLPRLQYLLSNTYGRWLIH